MLKSRLAGDVRCLYERMALYIKFTLNLNKKNKPKSMFLIILFGLKLDSKDFSYSDYARDIKGSLKVHFFGQFIRRFCF